ncbi:MAG TPA: dihydrofolate reductase [Noviherbaspirillum sp.]|nr:dihydrofolate reductase [Noviherbaspirillum sp.]
MTPHVPRLTIVVAMDRQRGIGVNNQLPWRLPEDLAHFKRTTMGHPIIMGRKTFDSIGRALPNRRNIVITRNKTWKHEGVEVAHSLDAALALVGEVPACIIGGAQIFEEALPQTGRLVVTHIDHDFPCKTFFPEIDPADWQEIARETHHSQANGFDFSYVTYERKSPLA